MAPVQHKGKHYAVASGPGFAEAFQDDLNRLGVAGFAEWLKSSFCGSDPSSVPGWFHSDSETLFGQLFGQAERYFDATARNIARNGIIAALSDFSSDQGSLYGLLELTGVVEAVRVESLIPIVARVIRSWFDPDQASFARELTDRDDIIALREILECVFRLQLQSSDKAGNFAPFAEWSSQILLNHPHSLRRAFVPAYAPMYMLALSRNATPQQKSRMATVIENGWRTANEPFPSLFIFPSTKIEGVLFPYNYDRLIQLASESSYGFQTAVVTEQRANPFQDIPASATHGTDRGRYDPEYAKQTLIEVRAA